MLYLKEPVKKIQKKLAIKSFLKTSLLDWRGHICCVVFLGGCNFRCPYCHNKDIVLWPERLSDIPLSEILDYISTYQEWIDGVVISGGEPCINSELPMLCELLRKTGTKIKLDTNGSKPKLLDLLIHEGLLDYIAMDFKSPLNETSYRRCTGIWTDIESIKQTIDLLLKGSVDYELRVTVCPYLLNIEDIKNMGERIQGAKRLVLQNYLPQNTLESSFADIVPYPIEKLQEMKEVMSSYVQECLIISPY